MLKVLLTIGGLQLATMVVMLVRTKGLALVLGPEGVGLMAVVDKLLAVVAQTISLSLPFAALRFLPELCQTDRRACYEAIRAMALTLGALALMATAGGALIALMQPQWLGSQWARLAATQPWLLVCAFLSLPALVFAPFIQNAFAGTLRHRSAMLFGLAHAGVQAFIGLAGALVAGLTGLYLSYAGAALALFAPALARVAKAVRPTPAPPLGGWRGALPPTRYLRFAVAMFALSVVAPLAALYAHYEVLKHHGAVAAGWMQSAIGISLAVRGVLGAAHSVYLTPGVNNLGDWPERMRWAARFQNLWCLLAGVLVPPVLLLANLAIVVLYAPAFLPATSFVHLFVLVEVVTMLAGTWQAIIVAADRIAFHVAQNLTAQLIYVAVVWFCIPRWGIAGAAWGALASQAFLFVATSAYLALRMGLRPPWRTAALIAYLLAMLVVAGRFGAQGTAFTAPGLGMAAAVYGLGTVGLLAFLRADERRQLAAMLLRLRARGQR